MADQPSLASLLQWSIANSVPADDGTTPATTQQRSAPTNGLNAETLAALMGGPSDADLMREAMTAIVAPLSQCDLPNKLIAWDNFEQMIENLDNANNMDPLGLWPPLVSQLDNEEPEMRRMAAWCCGTAVQNNVKSQEKALAAGAIPKLAGLAVKEDEVTAVRKKAITALSSSVRNFQPGLDELEKVLPEKLWKRKGLDATDMEQVDEVIEMLRGNVQR